MKYSKTSMYYSHLDYPQFLRPKFSMPKYADNRGLTVLGMFD